MLDTPMLGYIPLNLKPTERNSRIKGWIDSLLEGMNFEWLEPKEWFEEYHRDGNFIWNVPPSAGDVVYEKLDKARLKRSASMHIVIIPRLFTGLWRRLMTRRCDCYLRIDWEGVWDLTTYFEPLLFFVCIPYHIDRPFEERTYRLLEQFHRFLPEWKMQEKPTVYKRNLLCEFLQCAGMLSTL